MTSIITLFFLSLVVSIIVAIILQVPIIKDNIEKITDSINSKIEVIQ